MSSRLWYKVAAVVALLALAASAAESAPRTTSAMAKSAIALPLVPPSQAPHRAPRQATAIPPAPVQSNPPIPIARPAPPPAPRVTVGSGQWGLINQDRAAAGLAALRWSGCLAAVAGQNAVRMAAQAFISHTNGPTLDLGCHLGMQAGENVGDLSSGVNDAHMNGMFMASPEHRANILGPYHYVGVSWVVAPNGFAYIAVEFS